eukprot:TRINITY_DN2990_c0_g6_i1.p3 TRINITY_DN2990_c0_g6~~TRINITY_DN2990_c0_g6_i1.p3  ORF type:complete len:190 (-),score=16.99 TRINITY_DN2990_c0_g6_i1:232-801(-)
MKQYFGVGMELIESPVEQQQGEELVGSFHRQLLQENPVYIPVFPIILFVFFILLMCKYLARQRWIQQHQQLHQGQPHQLYAAPGGAIVIHRVEQGFPVPPPTYAAAQPPAAAPPAPGVPARGVPAVDQSKDFLFDESNGSQNCGYCERQLKQGQHCKLLPCGHQYHAQCQITQVSEEGLEFQCKACTNI